MILPLQTWHHQDPKGLWPAIGGLTVLAHIGIIGMSVPYLISLRETEAQNAAAGIPIELSVEPSTNSDSTEIPATETLATETPAAETLDMENDQPAVSDSRAVVESVIAPNRNADSAKRSHISKPPPVESPSTPERTSEQPDDTADSREEFAEDEEGKAIEDSGMSARISETPETPDGATEKLDTESEGLSQPPENPSEGIQKIANGTPLPSPSDNSQVGQTLQMRIIISPEHDPVEGFTGKPPVLVNPEYAGLLRPEEEGCGVVSSLAAQSILTYRIAVNADGTIYGASLVPGDQGIAPESEDAQAVACLIQKTGITFIRPDVSEGDESIDDSLLLTFELSEQ